MKCKECGANLIEGNKFCGKCGANTEVETVEVKAVEVEASKEDVEVKTGGPTGKEVVEKVQELWKKGVAAFKRLHTNQQIIIGVLVAALLMFMVGGLYNGGGVKTNQKTPEGVIKTFMKVLDTNDVAKFRELIDPSNLTELRMEFGFDEEYIDEVLEIALEGIKMDIGVRPGGSMVKDSEILQARQNSNRSYSVPLVLYGNRVEVGVIKMNDVYYIDMNTFY